MCGRTACSLDHETIRKACSYRDAKSGEFRQPKWIESGEGMQYYPSKNIAPTDVTPVLLSGLHFNLKDAGPVLHPMIWGMIPPWHKGNFKSHGLSTNNCRVENLRSSALYSPALSKGMRCVVLCEGFYEWQTTKKGASFKQPYFIYAPQPEGVHVEDPVSWNGNWSKEYGWTGPKLLKMAGIFNSWTSPEDKKLLFCYSIITMESNSTFSWLHHRMPAILHDDTEVMDWIDCGRVSHIQAPQLLKPVESLTWHPVSTLVNNSRNKDMKCNKPVDLKKPHTSPSSLLMQDWLKRPAISLIKKSSDSTCEAPQLLKPAESLTLHPVSTLVNNSHNKDMKCNKPVNLKKPHTSPSSLLMRNWLKRPAVSLIKKSSDSTSEVSVKNEIPDQYYEVSVKNEMPDEYYPPVKKSSH